MTITFEDLRYVACFCETVEEFNQSLMMIEFRSYNKEFRKLMVKAVCIGLQKNKFDELCEIKINKLKIKELKQIFDVIKFKPFKQIIVDFSHLFELNREIHLQLFPIIIDLLKNSLTIKSIHFNHPDIRIYHTDYYGCGKNQDLFKQLISAIDNNSTILYFHYAGLFYNFNRIYDRNYHNKEMRKENKSLQLKCWNMIKELKIDTTNLPYYLVKHCENMS